MHSLQMKIFATAVVFVSSLQILDAVTVKPERCPSNKIAPYKRVSSWNSRGRTFGYVFDLFGDGNNGGNGGGGGLQENPVEDEPDDCGEIEDYDEHDLSSIATNPQRREAIQNKLFLNWFNGGNEASKPKPPFFPGNPAQETPAANRPPHVTPPKPKPTRPPTRPPYYSGGVFANNPYRPPTQHVPSDAIKPVHEHNSEVPLQWQPSLVGGQIPQVVGVPVRPVRPPPPHQPVYTGYPSRPFRPNMNDYPQASTPVGTQGPQNIAPITRRPRPRRLNGDRSVFGSFIDLLF